MQTKIIATVGEKELEEQINDFVIGKNVIDIKFTEWVSYENQAGGYTAYILYDETNPPTINIQVKVIPANGELELESIINPFIKGRKVIDIKFTEWAEYSEKAGGYSALIIYQAEPNNLSLNRKPIRENNTPKTSLEESPKPAKHKLFDVI
ncbi:MAG: hypothetical protein ABIC91_07145 [Nanoarchaeota archaeon]|nr:hypothetical protein [Nanoarchaeota archaeon]MBU1030840.1 hypothetical protein [Nanoarchaeota archaeon]MBU1850251.1 hypothetical protein [Nanoarchaeota archaeon]